jgi:Flp pilus assembly protein TadG
MLKAFPFSRFLNDISGQFAVIFSIALIPILGAVGLAIDYSAAVQSAARLRDSTDAAAFFAVTEYRKTGMLPSNDAVLEFVSANFAVAPGEKEPAISSMAVVNGKLVLQTRVNRPLEIMQVFGNSDTVIATSSSIFIGDNEDLEIALVLDTTASMRAASGSSSTDLEPASADPDVDNPYFTSFDPNVRRIDALKFAAKRFTDTIFANDGSAGKIRVSVVPFAEYVNVGTDKRGASWLTVPNDQAATGETCYYDTPVLSSSNCHTEFYTDDGAQIPYTKCDEVLGPKEEICYPSGDVTWHGCVGSRDEPLNVRDASPNSKFTGIMGVWCAQPIQPLSGNKAAVLSTINNLWPSGQTYIPEGVMWGLRVLSTTIPYTEVKTASGLKKVRKIMVLMTDGDNQAAADIPAAPTHHGIHDATSDGQASPNYAAERQQTDDWTLKACSEAKKADVEVYTISFGTDVSAAAKGVVKSCATDAKHYFDAKDAAALSAAFSAIAARVNGMFLAG